MAECILLPQFPKEIDMSNYALANHSHSGYASSSHSHSGYASSSHSHSLSSLGIDESKMTINKTENNTYNITGGGWVSKNVALPTGSYAGQSLELAPTGGVGYCSMTIYTWNAMNRKWQFDNGQSYSPGDKVNVSWCLIP